MISTAPPSFAALPGRRADRRPRLPWCGTPPPPRSPGPAGSPPIRRPFHPAVVISAAPPPRSSAAHLRRLLDLQARPDRHRGGGPSIPPPGTWLRHPSFQSGRLPPAAVRRRAAGVVAVSVVTIGDAVVSDDPRVSLFVCLSVCLSSLSAKCIDQFPATLAKFWRSVLRLSGSLRLL